MEIKKLFESFHLSINDSDFIYKINSIDTWHGDQELHVTCEIKRTLYTSFRKLTKLVTYVKTQAKLKINQATKGSDGLYGWIMWTCHTSNFLISFDKSLSHRSFYNILMQSGLKVTAYWMESGHMLDLTAPSPHAEATQYTYCQSVTSRKQAHQTNNKRWQTGLEVFLTFSSVKLALCKQWYHAPQWTSLPGEFNIPGKSSRWRIYEPIKAEQRL